jgi:hypothetical protein
VKEHLRRLSIDEMVVTSCRHDETRSPPIFNE